MHIPQWVRDWFRWGISGWRQFLICTAVTIGFVFVIGSLILWVTVHILLPLVIGAIVATILYFAVFRPILRGGGSGGHRR